MDGYQGGLVVGDQSQSMARRVETGGTPRGQGMGQVKMIAFAQRPPVVLLIGREDDNKMHLGIKLMKTLQRPHEDGASADGQKLLGHVRPHTRALSTSHDHDIAFHPSRSKRSYTIPLAMLCAADALPGLCLTLKGRYHPLVVTQVGAAGHSAREQEHVSIREVASLFDHQVSDDRHTMGGDDLATAHDAHRHSLHTTPAKDIYRRQRLDLLKAVGQKFIHFCHNILL